MSTKPLVIKSSSWHYQLRKRLWGGEPKSLAGYIFGFLIPIFIILFLAVFVVMAVWVLGSFLLAAVSPLVLHFWPDNGWFRSLHDDHWDNVVFVFWFWIMVGGVAALTYWCLKHRGRFVHIGCWFRHHYPGSRQVTVSGD